MGTREGADACVVAANSEVNEVCKVFGSHCMMNERNTRGQGGPGPSRIDSFNFVNLKSIKMHETNI